MYHKLTFTFLIFSIIVTAAIGQTTPVEIVVGNKRASIDLLLVKYIKNKKQEKTNLLLFNRNRAVANYGITKTTNLPQFSVTDALSIDIKKWSGVAPIAVLQVLNSGVYPKLGIRYLKIKNNITLFCWAVVDVLHNPNIELFLLGRYAPKLSTQLHLYTQIELLHTIPTQLNRSFIFTQRFRIGFKISNASFGLATDINEIGRHKYNSVINNGIFYRYEF